MNTKLLMVLVVLVMVASGCKGSGSGTAVMNNLTDDSGITSPLSLNVADESNTGGGGEINGLVEITNPGNDVPTVPEPATLSLLGMGLFGLYRLKRAKK